MPLLFPSLAIFAYVFASGILFLPLPLWSKLVGGAVLLAVSMKYVIYVKLGGSFMAPDLARPLLLTMEVLYAALVLLFFVLLVKDAAALILWLSRMLGSGWRFPLSTTATNAALLFFALSLSAYGTWQSIRVPHVRTLEIPLPNLPADLNGFSIVQLTDLHVGPILKTKWLRAVVERTNATNPDVIVITGDMIDGRPEELRNEVAPFGELTAKHGVFGVTGNHEYYFGAEDWLQVFESLGVQMLHNEHRVLRVNGQELVLAGVPDRSERRYGRPGPDIQKALAGAPDAVTVLMAHQPRGASDHTAVDIQLSGHTHGGLSVLKQRLIARYNDGYVNGLYDVDGMKLYVSPGTGLWPGYSNRIGVPSEITRIVLRAQ